MPRHAMTHPKNSSSHGRSPPPSAYPCVTGFCAQLVVHHPGSPVCAARAAAAGAPRIRPGGSCTWWPPCEAQRGQARWGVPPLVHHHSVVHATAGPRHSPPSCTQPACTTLNNCRTSAFSSAFCLMHPASLNHTEQLQPLSPQLRSSPVACASMQARTAPLVSDQASNSDTRPPIPRPCPGSPPISHSSTPPHSELGSEQ